MKFIAQLLAGLIAALGLLVAPALMAGGDIGATDQVSAAGCHDVDGVLATIRHLESRGDYTVEAAGSSASGAYQFLDSTWANYAGYRRASFAPPEIQDERARIDVTSILNEHGRVDAVPVVWYIGRLPAEDDPRWDIVPIPEAGNVLTLREYQTRWMEQFELQAAAQCTVVGGVYDTTTFPQVIECSSLVWKGHRNGHVPTSALIWRPVTGQMHPQAGADYERLHAAAAAAGLNVSGHSYRSAAGQAVVGSAGAAVGKSCHGLGVAIDITRLVPCNPAVQKCSANQPYYTAADAFASPEYEWLCTNAASFGFINPRWAHPAGNQCGPVTGTGTGGGSAKVLEPWHWEAVGVITTHPDFVR